MYIRTHRRTDNVKTVYTPQTKFAGGIMSLYQSPELLDLQFKRRLFDFFIMSIWEQMTPMEWPILDPWVMVGRVYKANH